MTTLPVLLPGRANRSPSGFDVCNWGGKRFYLYTTGDRIVVYDNRLSFVQTISPLLAEQDSGLGSNGGGGPPHADMCAVAMSPIDGMIAASNGHLLYIYSPSEERPGKWDHVLHFEKMGVRQLSWGAAGQLYVGGETIATLTLTTAPEGSAITLNWERGVPGHIALLSVSPGHGIVASAALASRLVKVWVPTSKFALENVSGPMVDETDLYHFSYLPHPRMVSYIAFLAHSSGIVTMSVDGYCRIWSRVVAKPAAYFVASVLDCSKDLATYNEENQTNLSFDFISFSWAEPDSHANDFFDTTGMGDTVDAMLSLRTLTGEVFVWKLKSVYNMEEPIQFDCLGVAPGKGEEERCVTLSYMDIPRDDRLRLVQLNSQGSVRVAAIVPFPAQFSRSHAPLETWDIARWDGHLHTISKVAQDPTGEHLLTLSRDGHCIVWDMKTPLQLVRSFVIEDVESAVWVPDEAHNSAFVTTRHGHWSVYTFYNGSWDVMCEWEDTCPPSGLQNVILSPSEDHIRIISLYAHGLTRTLSLVENGSDWHLAPCDCKMSLKTEPKDDVWVSPFALADLISSSRNGHHLTVTEGKSLRIWSTDSPTHAPVCTYDREITSDVLSVSWLQRDKGGSFAVVLHTDHVQLYSTQRGSHFDGQNSWTPIGSFTGDTHLGSSVSWYGRDGSIVLGRAQQLALFPTEDVQALITETLSMTHHPAEVLDEVSALLHCPIPAYHPRALEFLGVIGDLSTSNLILERLHGCVDDLDEGTDPTSRYIYHGSMRTFFTLPAPAVESRYWGNVFKDLMTIMSEKRITGLDHTEQLWLYGIIEYLEEAKTCKEMFDEHGLRYLLEWRRQFMQRRSHKHAGNIFTQAAFACLSRSKDTLVTYVKETGGREAIRSGGPPGTLTWPEFRSLGITYWVEDKNSLIALVNGMARGQFLKNKDPTACSLLYTAMGRVSILLGLWRTASHIPEQRAMVQFLARDFKEERWAMAAAKNAYVLLGKQRFEMAATFFLLSGSLKDAVAVCRQHLKDPQLAYLLTRIYSGTVEPDYPSTLLKDITAEEGSACGAFVYHWIVDEKEQAASVVLSTLKSTDTMDPDLVVLMRGLRQRRFLDEGSDVDIARVEERFKRARAISGIPDYS